MPLPQTETPGFLIAELSTHANSTRSESRCRIIAVPHLMAKEPNVLSNVPIVHCPRTEVELCTEISAIFSLNVGEIR